MAKRLKKLLSMTLVLGMLVGMMGVPASAEGTEEPLASESVTTAVVNDEAKTVTLNDDLSEGIEVPDGYTVIVAANISIAGGEKSAITCEGALTIKGEGNLTLSGTNGIMAASVAIEGIDVDFTGTSCGIQVYNDAGDAKVSLTNVDGSIEGGYAGIYVNGECADSEASVSLDGCDLTVTSTATAYNNRARKSGITVYVSTAEKVESSINVANSKLVATGSDAGLAINNYLGDADATNSASSCINITDSIVTAEGTNGTWSGIFASVLGQHEDADSIITITNSSVYAVSPNTGILTSSQNGESKIILDNSILGASGETALSMVEPTSQAQVAELKNDSTYVQMTPAAVMKGEITNFDGKVIKAVDGEITYDADNNYFVIPQNATVTESYTDGVENEYTFTQQAGGVGGFDYDKEEVWGFDVPEEEEKDDAIIITTPEELIEFATKTQDGTLGDCGGKTVKLGNDIDMSGYDWYYRNAKGEIVTDHRIPEFSGILDGQGYSIKNMSYRDEYAEATDPMPLAFILTANGTFEDITIDGITVDTMAPARFGGFADALAYSGDGYTQGCTIKNVEVNADAQLAFGGFAFKILDVAHVTDCHVDGFTVNANGVLNGPNSGRCGGFFATGGEVTPFKDCSVSDFVLNAESTGTYVGGFVGGASMTAFYDNCDVKGFELNAKAKISAVGGFAGYTAGSAWGAGLKFEDCDVSGLDIETSDVISVGAGGFIGNLYGQGKSVEDGAHHFINCTTEGTISGDAYAGGFAGWLYGRPNGCVGNFDNCSAAVNIFDNDYYGAGFVGNYTPSGTNKMTAVYTNCTASGDVFAKEPVGSFLDTDDNTTDGIIGGTYNYDPENVDAETGETNNVAPGYRALDNGDGTWTVFPDNGKEVVKVAFHRWNDENDAYENWRTVEVFKDVNFLNPDHDNDVNYSHPIYRFKDGDKDGVADGLTELNKDADSAERPFTYWTDASDGNGNEVLTNDTIITGDMNVYVAYEPAKPEELGSKGAKLIDRKSNRYNVFIEVPGNDGDTRHDEVILMVDGSYSGDKEWPAMKDAINTIGTTVLDGSGATQLTLMAFGMGDNIVLEHVKDASELATALGELPGYLLRGVSSTNCEAGFTGVGEYIQNHDSDLKDAIVIYITDGGINTDETPRAFYDWQAYAPNATTVTNYALNAVSVSEIDGVSKDNPIAFTNALWKAVFEHSNMDINGEYPISEMERAFLQYDEDNGTTASYSFLMAMKNSKFDKYPNVWSRTYNSVLELGKCAGVQDLYLVRYQNDGRATWMPEAAAASDVDNIHYVKSDSISTLVSTLSDLVPELSRTPFNDVFVTDYMSKWVNLDPSSIQIIDNNNGKVIWDINDGWLIEENIPTAKNPPVVVELVDPADYAAGGDDVIGNASGDIYKLTWYVKDGAMLRSDNYKLSYEVTVDTKETGFEYYVDYPANGATELTYTDERSNDQTNDIDVPDVDAEITTATLQVKKVNENGAPLAGAVFEVFAVDGDTKTSIGTYAVDANGELTLDLEVGSHLLVETTAPSGYLTIAQPVDITVGEDLGISVTETKSAHMDANGNLVIANRPPHSAVVLTIDMSGTMYRYKMNGKRYVDVAKAKALEFVNEYAASANNNGKRMLSVVCFDTDAKVQQNWIDVSTASGLKTAVSAINKIKVADNGNASSNQVCTNFDGGVILARNLLKQDAVKDIDRCFAIILSDGAPTVTVNNDTDIVGTIKSSFWGKQYDGNGNYYQKARNGGGWTHPGEVDRTLTYLKGLKELTHDYVMNGQEKEGIFIVGVGGDMSFKLFNDAVYGTKNGTRTSDVKRKPAAFNKVEALAGYTQDEIMKLTTGDWMAILAEHVGGTYAPATDSEALASEFSAIVEDIVKS